MSFTVDGTGNSWTPNTGAPTTATCTLTTTETSDVLIAYVGICNTGGSTTTSTFNDTIGNWTLRKRTTLTDSSGSPTFFYTLEEWYSTSSAAYSKTLTANLSAAISTSNNHNGVYILAFGMNGGSTGAPFDTSGALPVAETVTSTASAGNTYSTTATTTRGISCAFPFESQKGTQIVQNGSGSLAIQCVYVDNVTAQTNSTNLELTSTATDWLGIIDALVPGNPTAIANPVVTTLKAPTQIFDATVKAITIAQTLKSPTQVFAAQLVEPATITTTLLGFGQAMQNATAFTWQAPIDGLNAVYGNGPGITSMTANLTTTLHADSIIAVVGIISAGNPGTVDVTSVSGGGLTWTRRSRNIGWVQTSGAYTYTQVIEVWYAEATNPLNNVAITATLNAATAGANNNEGATSSLAVFGFNGANNPADPWDAESPLTYNQATQTQAIGPYSTIASVTYSFSFTLANDAGPSSPAVTLVNMENGLSYGFWGQQRVSYIYNTSPQRSSTNLDLTGGDAGFTVTVDSIDMTLGVSANATTNLPTFRQIMNDEEVLPFTIAQTLPHVTQIFDAGVTSPTTITTTLRKLQQVADVAVNEPNMIRQTFPSLGQVLDGRVTNTFPVTVTMNLPNLSQRLACAVVTVPPILGGFYSYWS